jgi:UDPglucose 6-dehydrogenase
MIGAGYVGLVTGACLADYGHEVVCVDKDPAKIAALRKGVTPIYEPGLDDLLAKNAAAGRLSFAADLRASVADAQVVFIAVGTPARRGDGYADLSHVYAVAREIAAAITGFVVVATKSTVPVGTGDEVERILREARPDADFAVVSNPEFLREGAAIIDFKRPDRIVIGSEDPRGEAAMRSVYRPLFLNESPLMFVRRRAAELIKYASNSFLATKITFINEMADLCEQVGADIQEVARGIGLDKRIGDKFLHAGPGYGGSCFPKDTTALLKTAQDFNVQLRIVETVVSVNETRRRVSARKIVVACGGSVRGKRIAILGLTFKPNTDDTREAPALSIIAALQDAGAAVIAYDPVGVDNARPSLTNVTYADNPYSCAEGCDAVAIVTEWDEFRALDLDRLKTLLRAPILVDFRNIYRPNDVAAHGLTYVGVGRPTSSL